MQNSAIQKAIRLADVARALLVNRKVLESWLAKEKFDLIGDREGIGRQWRTFSYLDVAHLALAAQMIRYGFTISDAHDFAGAALIKMISPMGGIEFLDQSCGGAIAALGVGRDLYLMRIASGEVRAYLAPDEPAPQYDAALHIRVGQHIAHAFNGLREFGHDAFDPEGPDGAGQLAEAAA